MSPLPRCRFCGRIVSEAWRTACVVHEGEACQCGHAEALHSAFTARVTPGVTRTVCDVPSCRCQSWVLGSEARARRASAEATIRHHRR